MKKIDDEMVRKIADLAMIDLTDEEIEKYAKQFTSILEYVEILDEVKLDGEVFKTHVDLRNVMREDEVEPGLTSEEAVSQGANHDGYILVPSVL